jgi:hypothetical protein
MMATMAFCSSGASFSIACARRAKVRSATTVMVLSVSQKACTRRFAAVLSIAASFWPRNLTRMGSGAGMTRLKTCCWASVETLIAERASSQEYRQCLAFAPGCGEFPTAVERSPRSADRIERMGLRAVATRSWLRAIQLDDNLGHLHQVTTQASTVTAGPLDRPGPANVAWLWANSTSSA